MSTLRPIPTLPNLVDCYTTMAIKFDVYGKVHHAELQDFEQEPIHIQRMILLNKETAWKAYIKARDSYWAVARAYMDEHFNGQDYKSKCQSLKELLSSHIRFLP